MLYDPYGDSEDGVITLKPESDKLSFDVVVAEWSACKNGVQFEQNDDVIVLDSDQIEQLYYLLKHNR